MPTLGRNPRTRALLAAVAMAVVLCAAPAADGRIIFVDIDAQGAKNGTSWPDAFNDLQDALAAAAAGDEIWVAEGTYIPRGSGGVPADTFALIDDVGIYGGFAGIETLRAQRDPLAHPTTLRGYLVGGTHRVVTSDGNASTALLDGFTVRDGWPLVVFPLDPGGGLYISNGNPTITACRFEHSQHGVYLEAGAPTFVRCTFSDNPNEFTAGAGIVNDAGSPTFIECTFRNNDVDEGIGGAGMYNRNATALLIRCSFIDNFMFAQDVNGVGVYNDVSSPVFIDCRFIANRFIGDARGRLPARGGAVFNSADSHPTFIGCLFSANQADPGAGRPGHGGAIYNGGNASPLVANCSFVNNIGGGADSPGFGGAIYNDAGAPVIVNCTFRGNIAEPGYPKHTGTTGGIFNDTAAPIITNCVLWENRDPNGTGESAQILGGTPNINYSAVQGLTGNLGGIGNIGDDPLLTAEGRLSRGSPGIDAGENTALPPDTFDLDGNGDTREPIPFDLDGNARQLDDPTTPDTGNGAPPVVDMGAFEFQTACLADLDGDGQVDLADLGILLADFGCNAGNCPGDIDGDGDTDLVDLGILLSVFGGVCP